MRYVIRIVEAVGKVIDDEPSDLDTAPAFVKWCDVNARDGIGLMETTDDLRDAINFATQGEAVKYVCRQSEVKPLRDDGRPNRPLTAFTVSIEPVETLH